MKVLPITNKQKIILLLLFRFRFLNRIHIQKLLKHKQHNRINTWLKDLTEKQYIARIINDQSTIHNIPAIYHLTKNAIPFLRTQTSCEKSYLNKLYREHKRSKYFIHDECMFTADIYLSLLNKYESIPEFEFYTPSDYTRNGIVKEIFPLFVFRRKKEESYHIVEMFRERIPRDRALYPRLGKYLTTFTKAPWIKHEKPPVLLFICPDKKIQKSVVSFVREYMEEEGITGLKVYVGQKADVKKKGVEGEVWRRITATRSTLQG